MPDLSDLTDLWSQLHFREQDAVRGYAPALGRALDALAVERERHEFADLRRAVLCEKVRRMQEAGAHVPEWMLDEARVSLGS